MNDAERTLKNFLYLLKTKNNENDSLICQNSKTKLKNENCYTIIVDYLKILEGIINQKYLINVVLPFFASLVDFLNLYGLKYLDLLIHFNIIDNYTIICDFSNDYNFSETPEFINKYFEEYFPLIFNRDSENSSTVYKEEADFAETLYNFYEWLFYSDKTNFKIMLLED